MQQSTDNQLIDSAIKLYRRINGIWHTEGYRCPKCKKHYYKPTKLMLSHFRECVGKNLKILDNNGY